MRSLDTSNTNPLLRFTFKQRVLVINAVSFALLSIVSLLFAETMSTFFVAIIATEPEMVEVIVPTRNILVGETLDKSKFRLDRRTRESVPADALMHLGAIHNHYAKQELAVNLPITQAFITTVRPVNSPITCFARGFRPFTISVPDLHATDPYPRTGMEVDIISTRKIGKTKKATIVANRAKLLSINRDPEADRLTVVFLLPLLDATKVEEAQSEGEISFALREEPPPPSPSPTIKGQGSL